jgi:hypothetical protein
MKRILIALTALILFSLQINAQQSRDVLFLKNGSIVYGKLLEIKNDQYSIKTVDGLLFSFTKDEVDKFILGEQSQEKEVKINDPNGLGFGIESGLLLGSGGDNFPIFFSMNTMLTYTFKSRNTLSFVTGTDLIEQFYLPLLVEYKVNILKKGFSPLLYVKGGALVCLNMDDEYENYKGGWTVGAGTGFRWPSGGFESYMKFGFRYAFTVRENSYYYNSDYRINSTYHSNYYRLEIKWGFRF